MRCPCRPPSLCVAAVALCCARAHADFGVTFDRPGALDRFTIGRPDPDHLQLDPAAGALVITTQPGDIYQTANNCRNLLTVPAPEGDFEVVLAVRRFEPSAPTHHLSLGIFRNDDQLVRLTYWWRGPDRAVNLDREDDAFQTAVRTGPVDFGSRPFRLRLQRQGSRIAAAWSGADGVWTEWGTVEWDGQVRRVGFYAANSTSPECPSTEAAIEAFGMTCAGELPAQEPEETVPPPLISEDDLVQYHAIRGFNYVPSYAADGREMWEEFSADTWDRELSWVEQLRGNAIRIWLEPRAWEQDPGAFARALESALSVAARHGLRVIPTLFNCWPSVRPAEWAFGHLVAADMSMGSLRRYEPYVRSVIAAHRDDARVLMWDLINEPDFVGGAMEPFIPYYCAFVRSLGTSRPLTIGFGGWPLNERFGPLLDVLTLHIYATDVAGHEAAITGVKDLGRRLGQPVICNECVVGAADDAQHRQNAEAAASAMEQGSMGYLVWALVDGEIASLRPDREEGSNSYQSFFHADGTSRAAVSALRWGP